MAAKLRAVGYCRTSGEGQRDNTSIPTQRDAIEAFCKTNDWSFAKFYVDESKSGCKIEGRDEFNRMVADAALKQFDVIVVYSITRFARDSVDILQTAKYLKSTFSISTVSTQHDFDNSKFDNTLLNTVHAGVAEHERLAILKRTQHGRVARAKDGKSWGPKPVGRDYDKVTGKWSVSEQGRMIAGVMQRYADGETWSSLRKEKGIKSRNRISQWVKTGQLSGIYMAHFDCPDIGLDEHVPVPQIPQIISQKLLDKVKARLSHNRTYNRHDTKKYPLTGFIRCEDCGKSLTGQIERDTKRYRHKNDGCTMRSIRGDVAEPAILDYLYGAFLDKPNYDKAVDRAMPSTEHRQEIIKELAQVEKQSTKNEQELGRLVDAITKGADPTLLIGTQDQLKANRLELDKRSQALQTELSTMPSAKQTKIAADITRIHLMQQHTGKDWRELSHDEIQQFMFHLFGESKIGSGNGIFLRTDNKGRIVATFRGQLEFNHKVVDGRPISKIMSAAAKQYGVEIKREFDMAMKEG